MKTEENFRPAPQAPVFDVAVVGGGPAGATAAHDLAKAGLKVLLLDRPGRIKPCGGAVPPILLKEFDIPEELLEARVTCARMIAPSGLGVDMEIGGFVGMVDRAEFDPWLRERAVAAGAEIREGMFKGHRRDRNGTLHVKFQPHGKGAKEQMIPVKSLIGADGANSAVVRDFMPKLGRPKHVFAYHEIVKSPGASNDGNFDPERCDVYYQGEISPDFYGWVFPHGEKTSIGTGTAKKGLSLKQATGKLRASAGLAERETIRCEGAPLPLRTLKRWDNGQDVVVAGDAAGAVAPSSGEGIYYAMYSGRLAGEAVQQYLVTGDSRALKTARKRFMKDHGRVFKILGIMQFFWYTNDRLRERFVKICQDPDVQKLTWEAYMNKKLVKRDPMAHIRIFFKDLAHLVGIAPR